VGKLAGLPESVIMRARAVLHLLEGEGDRLVPTLARDARGANGENESTANGRRAAPRPTDQLALFAPTAPHPVVDRLRQTDANTLTPLAALQLVAELAERARGDA
jgi:DNA mismatch repair ATPase MutS